MKLSAIIISLVLVLIFAVLIWYANYIMNRKRKSIINNLLKFAKGNGYDLTEYDTIGSNAIGIDKLNNVVVYQKLNKDINVIIPLKKIRKCLLNEKGRNITVNKNNLRTTDKLEFTFYPVDANNPPIDLEFYNEEKGDTQLTGEHQFINFWANLINEHINKKS